MGCYHPNNAVRLFVIGVLWEVGDGFCEGNAFAITIGGCGEYGGAERQ